jgi:TPP-dependent pyruvate/acetoin dehydrogenase alpha subunit
MLKIRLFEEKIVELYPEQEMKTPVHLCLGQEAIAAGVCAHLHPGDHIFSTHRNHGHCLAKGMDMNLLMAEIYGKRTGCSKGKGGSMHPVAPEVGILGTTSIVGGCIALATGTALASKMRHDNRVSVTFFGDGAVDEGIFHESLNFAALKQLPVVYVCENNFYACNSPLAARQPHDNIALRAQGYDIPSIQVHGNDVQAVWQAALEAISRARAGHGPTLLECRTYRWKGHVGPECDWERGCRPKEELEAWMARCPVEAYQEHLLAERIISNSELQALIQRINDEINAAVQFGKESPFPEKSDLFEDVFFVKD